MDIEKNKVFPQANDFKKILKLISFTSKELKDNELIMNELDVSGRQVNYYLSALEYLGLIERREFTILGQELKRLPKELFNKNLIKIILSYDIFFDVFYEVHFLKNDITAHEIGELIYLSEKISKESVAYRRGSTVKNWVNWILKEIK